MAKVYEYVVAVPVEAAPKPTIYLPTPGKGYAEWVFEHRKHVVEEPEAPKAPFGFHASMKWHK